MPTTKKKPRATKAKVSWIKKEPREEHREIIHKAWLPIMGKPTGEYSPMEQYLREHENGSGDPEDTVRLMYEFQEHHVQHHLCDGREIARMIGGSRAKVWYGCPDCGNVKAAS